MIEKENRYLIRGNGAKEHLKEPSDKDSMEEIATIKQMVSEGKSYRFIASELGISLGKVQRALKK